MGTIRFDRKSGAYTDGKVYVKASYTRGTFNWQQGFGIIYIDRKRVQPVAIPIERDGSFIVEGKRFG